MSQDDLTALSDIGNSIIHDSALTSSILKVANSGSRKQSSAVTTVSRACVVLGFKKLRNICITVKLLSGLLKNATLNKAVYIELLKLMSQSFHAAMLAKMMLVNYDEDTQEEIFIATLLTHLGESAFWSMGGEITEKLEIRLRRVTDVSQRNAIIKQQLGVSFEELNYGLANAWHLSDVLIKSMDNPQARTPELQVIQIADRASRCFAERGALPSQRNQLIERIASQLNISVKQAVKRINQCQLDTVEMLDSLGVAVLKQFIYKQDIAYIQLDTAAVDGFEPAAGPVAIDAKVQLKWLRKLTMLSSTRVSLNQVIELSIEALSKTLQMDKVMLLMFDKNEASLIPRFYSENCDRQTVANFGISLNKQGDLFSLMQDELQAIWVRENVGERYKTLVSQELKRAVSKKGYFMAPVMANHKCIGFFYVDKSISNKSLTSDDFAVFEHFSQLTSLCLSAMR